MNKALTVVPFESTPTSPRKGNTTMAASPYSIDPTTYLDELLAQASPDLMRGMLQGFINQSLSTIRGSNWRHAVSFIERQKHHSKGLHSHSTS